MSDQIRSEFVSRRTSSLPRRRGAVAGADRRQRGSKNGADRGEVSAHAQRRQTVRGCNLFVAPNSCKSVAGDIAPTGWCSIWVKKAEAPGSMLRSNLLSESVKLCDK